MIVAWETSMSTFAKGMPTCERAAARNVGGSVVIRSPGVLRAAD
jgi:hypothetical protein